MKPVGHSPEENNKAISKWELMGRFGFSAAICWVKTLWAMQQLQCSSVKSNVTHVGNRKSCEPEGRRLKYGSEAKNKICCRTQQDDSWSLTNCQIPLHLSLGEGEGEIEVAVYSRSLEDSTVLLMAKLCFCPKSA